MYEILEQDIIKYNLGWLPVNKNCQLWFKGAQISWFKNMEYSSSWDKKFWNSYTIHNEN